MSEPTWKAVAKGAQDYLQASIDRVRPVVQDLPHLVQALDCSGLPKKLLSAKEVEITETSTENLVSALAKRKYNAVEVVSAFLRRAVIAQHATNCVTELLPERAIERAKYLDSYLLKTKKTKGPLHGVPISVKEHIGMKDLGCNAGFVSWWDHRAPEDALVLKLLWKAGCCLLRTSRDLLQFIRYHHQSFQSCLSIGTDISSVRSPAANCGLYSLRPTVRRVPYGGYVDTSEAQELILGTIGPMSTSLEGLNLFMESVLDGKPSAYEPGLMDTPWSVGKGHYKYDKKRKLKVAVMWHDGVVKPHPPITRTLKEVVSKLKSLDWVEVVDWKPFMHDEAWKIIAESNFPEKGDLYVKDHTTNEPSNLYEKRNKYRTEYANHWNATAVNVKENEIGDCSGSGKVDVILCPAGPVVAPKLGTCKYWSYTSQWNLVNYPAFVFPVSNIDLEKDVPEKNFKPLSIQDEENYKLYTSPEDFKGAPVSLQLVGRECKDEKVLEVLGLIKDAISVPFIGYT